MKRLSFMIAAFITVGLAISLLFVIKSNNSSKTSSGSSYKLSVDKVEIVEKK